MTSLRLCVWCAAAAAVEVTLYWSYRGHDARFHWFPHLFVGSSVTLVAMAAVTLRTARPVTYPLAWPVLGHLFSPQARQLSECFRAISGKLDVVSLQPQRSADGAAQRLIVVDHDYPRCHAATFLVTVATTLIELDAHERTMKKG